MPISWSTVSSGQLQVQDLCKSTGSLLLDDKLHMGNHVLAEVVAPLLRGFDSKVCEKYLSSRVLCTGMKTQQRVQSWMHAILPLEYRTAFKVN